MIKFTDPTYSDQFFVVDNDCIYTVDKNNLNELLHALDEQNEFALEKYRFKLNDLDEDENHFHTIFQKLNTPYIRLLFHE